MKTQDDKTANYFAPEIDLHCVLCGKKFSQMREVFSLRATCDACPDVIDGIPIQFRAVMDEVEDVEAV